MCVCVCLRKANHVIGSWKSWKLQTSAKIKPNAASLCESACDDVRQPPFISPSHVNLHASLLQPPSDITQRVIMMTQMDIQCLFMNSACLRTVCLWTCPKVSLQASVVLLCWMIHMSLEVFIHVRRNKVQLSPLSNQPFFFLLLYFTDKNQILKIVIIYIVLLICLLFT